MATFSPDHEGEVPVIRTEAEITLKRLLDKQLSTAGRLEQVEFQEATESMHCLGYGSSGVASLSEFLENESAQKKLEEKARCLRGVLHRKGYSKDKVEERCRKMSRSHDLTTISRDKGTKQNGYGAHPSFIVCTESEELDIAALQNKHAVEAELKADSSQQSFGRHAKELEASLLRGKDKLQAIAHLAAEGNVSRKPLISRLEQSEIYIGMTPQDRARFSAEQEVSRTVCEVFSNQAPDVLNLHTYLDQRPKLLSTRSDTFKIDNVQTGLLPSNPQIQAPNLELDKVEEIPEQNIICNRLSHEEIRQLPGGKFANYSPGQPSHILYIKNLSADVTKSDLVGLFLRYQFAGQELLFRLLKRGRMKGQAFITFPDKDTSARALQLVNGYKLKGKPMVIEFGHAHS